MNQNNPKKVFRRVSAYLCRHPRLFSLTLILACLATALAVAIPSIIQRVLDRIIQEGLADAKDFLPGIAFIGLLLLCREVFNCLRIRVNNSLEQKVIFELRGDLHEKLLNLPVGFFDRRKSGDVSSRVLEDVQNVERAILDGTEQGIVALLSLVGVSVMMFYQDPRLAWVVLLPLPILGLMAFNYARVSKRNWREVRDASGELNSLLIEDIQGNRLIHSFALVDREKNRFADLAGKVKKASLKAMYRWSIQGPLASLTASTGKLAMIALGAYLLATDKGFSTGQFLAFVLYADMFYTPIQQLVGINNLIAAGKASGERVFEILDSPLEVLEPQLKVSFPSDSHDITFQKVSFSYAERSPVVSELSFELPHGSTTALVGPTGSGKSTIANLLQRYYDVEKGFITIGGKPLDQFSLVELRTNISMVSQDPFLFDASVRDNLLLAKAGCTDMDLQNALQAAQAWEFVKRLPLGMDTLIGERGVRLSMGEKQRITLARAMLKSSPILILDEATSSVDVETERDIQQAIHRLIKDRTTIIIAHRLSTIREADQIIFLEKGQIVESGSHLQLTMRGGAYANFCNLQENLV